MCFSIKMQCTTLQVSALNLWKQPCCTSRGYLCTVPIFRQQSSLWATYSSIMLLRKILIFTFHFTWIVMIKTLYMPLRAYTLGELGSAPQLNSTFWRKEKSLVPAWNQIPDCPVCSPVLRQCATCIFHEKEQLILQHPRCVHELQETKD
jgi:hypothetical protein